MHFHCFAFCKGLICNEMLCVVGLAQPPSVPEFPPLDRRRDVVVGSFRVAWPIGPCIIILLDSYLVLFVGCPYESLPCAYLLALLLMHPRCTIPIRLLHTFLLCCHNHRLLIPGDKSGVALPTFDGPHTVSIASGDTTSP